MHNDADNKRAALLRGKNVTVAEIVMRRISIYLQIHPCASTLVIVIVWQLVFVRFKQVKRKHHGLFALDGCSLFDTIVLTLVNKALKIAH
jgi:hypothetical protein